jgi:uncharacterized protein YbjT (DUF2867 family)
VPKRIILFLFIRMSTSSYTLFGGTGFIGRSITHKLIELGAHITIVTQLKTHTHLPFYRHKQVTYRACDYTHATWLDKSLFSNHAVINLIGILYPRRGASFSYCHTELAATIAQACHTHQAHSHLLVSAIGADASSASQYAQSKAAGELRAKTAYPQTIIIRPSVVFGKDDQFVNRFHDMSRFSPVLPVFGGGINHMQPVFVEDVAKAAIVACSDKKHASMIYELGGPKTYRFYDLLQLILSVSKRTRIIASIPYALAKIMALGIERLMPQILTYDQVLLLQKDNTVAKDANTLHDLGIKPANMEDVLPSYIAP